MWEVTLKYFLLYTFYPLSGGRDAQPIYRPRKTSLKKTLIYRLVVDPVALLITYVFTGELSGSIIAVVLIEIFSTAFYYLLDRLM
ncbi:MAG: DUF2061 domain-containing protein [Candidatus Bathyarchaeia archaeon]